MFQKHLIVFFYCNSFYYITAPSTLKNETYTLSSLRFFIFALVAFYITIYTSEIIYIYISNF